MIVCILGWLGVLCILCLYAKYYFDVYTQAMSNFYDAWELDQKEYFANADKWGSHARDFPEWESEDFYLDRIRDNINRAEYCQKKMEELSKYKKRYTKYLNFKNRIKCLLCFWQRSR